EASHRREKSPRQTTLRELSNPSIGFRTCNHSSLDGVIDSSSKLDERIRQRKVREGHTNRKYRDLFELALPEKRRKLAAYPTVALSIAPGVYKCPRQGSAGRVDHERVPVRIGHNDMAAWTGDARQL